MKIAVGSDEKTKTTDFVVDYLKRKGHEVRPFGALVIRQPRYRTVRGQPADKALWSEVAWEVAEAVKSGKVEEGILMCWTGTGVALAAK